MSIKISINRPQTAYERLKKIILWPLLLTVLLNASGAHASKVLPAARVGEPYEYTVGYTGLVNPIHADWSELPEWLEADGHVLKGTPKKAETEGLNFTVKLTGQTSRTIEEDFNLRILPPVRPLELAKSPLPPLPQNEPVNVPFLATGGEGNLTWDAQWIKTIQGLEVEIDEENGTCRLKGKAESEGNFKLIITVRDEAESVDRHEFTGTVRPLAVPLRIVSANILEATCNTLFKASLKAEGGMPPYKWSIDWHSSPPPGIEPSIENDEITGRPTHAGEFPLTINLNDSFGNKISQDANLRVSPYKQKPFIVKKDFPEGMEGKPFDAVIFGGIKTDKIDLKWNITGEPDWLNWEVSNNMAVHLTGVPETNGNWNINAELTTRCPAKTPSGEKVRQIASASHDFQLKILPIDIDPLQIMKIPPPIAVENLPYQYCFTATGGRSPLTFSFTGDLPDNMSTNTEGIIQTEEISSSGHFPFAVIAESADGQSQRFDTALKVLPESNLLPLEIRGNLEVNILPLRKFTFPLPVRGGVPPYKVKIEPTSGVNIWTPDKGTDIVFRIKRPQGIKTTAHITDSLGQTVRSYVVIQPILPIKYAVATALIFLLMALLVWIKLHKRLKQKNSITDNLKNNQTDMG